MPRGKLIRRKPAEEHTPATCPALPGTTETPCPVCGFASAAGEIRCPRCFALKLRGCSGNCGSCGVGR